MSLIKPMRYVLHQVVQGPASNYQFRSGKKDLLHINFRDLVTYKCMDVPWFIQSSPQVDIEDSLVHSFCQNKLLRLGNL
jgi:hypothetical protein